MDYVNSGHRMLFPRAFAFVLDDIGWNEGSDLSIEGVRGPHRAGVKRVFDLNDYKYIVEVGKAVSARIQCSFVLSEMDRENVLRKFPTTTYQRDQWNNTFRVSDKQLEIMQYVCDQAAYLEFGIHGVGHEYWPPGENRKRAEWYNLTDKKPWPENSLREHLQCFKTIMAQYGLSEENGHSFPESFVPCNYGYYWNPSGDYSLGKLLTEMGVKYASTDFSKIPELKPPQGLNGGGFDYGTHVINRLQYGNLWYELASLPKLPVHQQETDIVETHWVNWLAQDDFLQPAVTLQWINYYRSVQQSKDRYIAKNTEQLHSQWLYRKYTSIKEIAPGVVTIDNTQMPDEPYKYGMLGNLVLKIMLQKGEHISSAVVNDRIVPAYYEDEGFGFLYFPRLDKEEYLFKYEVGVKKMSFCIFNDGTFNVYRVDQRQDEIAISVKMYGSQIIKIKCHKPQHVVSVCKGLCIKEYRYNEESKILAITLKASDFQGKAGEIRLLY